jgi:hypothetical protein
MEINQPKGVKSKVRGRKVRSGVYWQRALKPKGVNQMDVKRPIYMYGKGDHSSACNAKVKNEWISLSSLTICLQGV